MAAYHAERWIEQAVESVRAQEPLADWRFELRIGVDACNETAAVLRRMEQPYWRPRENVGAYVLRNSLIALGPADCYAIFDADDVMCPAYLRTLIPHAWPDRIAGPARQTINADGELIERHRVRRWEGGVFVIGTAALERLGGYRAWPVAADSDLMWRAKDMGIRVRSVHSADGGALLLRRRHHHQVTRSRTVGIGTPFRRSLSTEGRRLREAGELFVHPETRKLYPWPA